MIIQWQSPGSMIIIIHLIQTIINQSNNNAMTITLPMIMIITRFNDDDNPPDPNNNRTRRSLPPRCRAVGRAGSQRAGWWDYYFSIHFSATLSVLIFDELIFFITFFARLPVVIVGEIIILISLFFCKIICCDFSWWCFLF